MRPCSTPHGAREVPRGTANVATPVNGRDRTARASNAVTCDLSRYVEVGECHEWTGSFGMSGNRRTRTPVVYPTPGRKLPTRRAVWLAAGRPIPEGHKVYATCHNHTCIRLEHLACAKSGTQLRARGRAGLAKHSPSTIAAIAASARARSPYTDAQRERVRELRALGWTLDAIAAETGVKRSSVSDIGRGKAGRGAASAFTWRP